MKRIGLVPLLVFAGCTQTPTQQGPSSTGANDGGTTSMMTEPPVTPDLPSVALCNNAPLGRAYMGLAGENLEEDRADVAAGHDTRRPYRNFYNNNGDWVVVLDVQRAVGKSPSVRDPEIRDPGFGASYGVNPGYWYGESDVGAFAVFVTFNYAFKACRREFDAERAVTHQPWYVHTATEPTAVAAEEFCRGVQTKAWKREPSAAETQSCVDLALNLAEEPDFKNRWAYVCASVLSSATWLSN